MKPIPTLEETSAEYARLMAMHVAMMERDAAINEERRTLQAQAGTELPASRHADRVNSLLAGIDYSAPQPIKDRLADLSAEQRAILEALKELSNKIALERARASRLIVDQFAAEHQQMAAEFFTHIAAAAAAHAKFGDARRRFYRAGVDPAGFTDFGQELFDDPGHRNSVVGVAMRAAARRGYLKKTQIPEAYR